MREHTAAPLGYSRWLWRIRRALALAAGHRRIARFAGGYGTVGAAMIRMAPVCSCAKWSTLSSVSTTLD